MQNCCAMLLMPSSMLLLLLLLLLPLLLLLLPLLPPCCCCCPCCCWCPAQCFGWWLMLHCMLLVMTIPRWSVPESSMLLTAASQHELQTNKFLKLRDSRKFLLGNIDGWVIIYSATSVTCIQYYIQTWSVRCKPNQTRIKSNRIKNQTRIIW